MGRDDGKRGSRRIVMALLAAGALLFPGGVVQAEDGEPNIVAPKDQNGSFIDSHNKVSNQGKEFTFSNNQGMALLHEKEMVDDWTNANIFGGFNLGPNGHDVNYNHLSLHFDEEFTTEGSLAGGYTYKGKAENNIFEFQNDAPVFINEMYGGCTYVAYESVENDASYNTLTVHVKDHAVIKRIGGGGTASGNVRHNSVHLYIEPTTPSDRDILVAGSIAGGGCAEGNVEDNKVLISGKGNILIDRLYGGSGGGFDVENNRNEVDINLTGKVEIRDGLMGSYSGGTGNENKVFIRSGNVISHKIVGAYSDDMDTNGNEIHLLGGEIEAAEITGGDSLPKNSNGNRIFLQDVKLKVHPRSYSGFVEITGGIGEAGYGTLQLHNNEIQLNSSLSLDNVNLYGWNSHDRRYGKISHSGNKLTVNSTGNTVHGLYNFDNITFTKGDTEKAALTVSDMDLNLKNKGDTSYVVEVSSMDIVNDKADIGEPVTLIDATNAANAKGLDELRYTPAAHTLSYKNGGVKVTGMDGVELAESGRKLIYRLKSIETIEYGTLDWDEKEHITLDKTMNFDLTNTKVDVTNLSFTPDSLKQIDKEGTHQMTLLDTEGNKTLKDDNIIGNKESSWTLANALTGRGTASLEDSGNLIYTMDASDSVKATEETHHILMGREGDMALLSAGKDRMMNVFSSLGTEEGETMVFASVGYGYDRYDTGSHIKSHNWTGLAGAGRERAVRNGTFAYGLFYERGDGSYKTYDAGFTGKGDNDYNGAGFLLRYMTDNKTYVEGSLRMGHMNSHGENMLRDASGKPLSYDSGSNYWGAHIGMGRIFDLTGKKANTSQAGVERAVKDIDVYGKYFHTYLGSDTVTVNGIDYDLDSMDSDLLRIGSRFNYRKGRNNFYAGLAFDYEMSGKGTGTVSAAGMSAAIRSTDTKGSSLMAEAGWKLESTRENPWVVDVSLAAYTGQHRGVYGNVTVGYHF